jgi:hypothetical protein
MEPPNPLPGYAINDLAKQTNEVEKNEQERWIQVVPLARFLSISLSHPARSPALHFDTT